MKVRKAGERVLPLSKNVLQKGAKNVRSSCQSIQKEIGSAWEEEGQKEQDWEEGVQRAWSKKAPGQRELFHFMQEVSKKPWQPAKQRIPGWEDAKRRTASHGRDKGSAGRLPHGEEEGAALPREAVRISTDARSTQAQVKAPAAALKGKAPASVTKKPLAGTGTGAAVKGAKGVKGGQMAALAAQASQTAKKGALTTAKTAAGAATAGAGAAAITAVQAVNSVQTKTRDYIKKAAERAAAMKASGKEGQAGEQKRTGSSRGRPLTAGLASLAILMLFIPMVIISIVTPLKHHQDSIQNSYSDQIVAVAEEELHASGANIGGTKYKTWYGMNDNWCVMFLAWCANSCGLIEMGLFPRTASVSALRSWYEEKGLYAAADGAYDPKAGDYIIFGNGSSHTGLVVDYDPERKMVTTIEGNTGHSDGSPYHTGSRVQKKTYVLPHARIVGFCTPNYPQAMVEIPEPYGSEYSYMGWQVITSPSSYQYKLRQEAGMNFDENGFGVIGNRYVIACTLTFGKVGDFIDWELSNGTVIKSVVGDIKNQQDPGCNSWGHKNGLCVVEFVVDKASWYGTDRYPTDFHGDWAARVVKATKTGSYWPKGPE